MKKTRKIIALLLTLLTLMSVLSAATPVFAEEVTELKKGRTGDGSVCYSKKS